MTELLSTAIVKLVFPTLPMNSEVSTDVSRALFASIVATRFVCCFLPMFDVLFCGFELLCIIYAYKDVLSLSL